MKEITGDLWDYYNKPGYVICLTTNGTVKTNGECVMGRGCAMEAKQRIPQIAALIGYHIQHEGNTMYRIPGEYILTFPVKHNWWERADLKLIEESARALAGRTDEYTYVLPRPGCGNGRLTWAQVKPVIDFLPDNVLVISH